MNRNNPDYWQRIFFKIGIYSIIGCIVYVIFNLQAFGESYISDTIAHVERILPIINGEYYLPHSLMHYLIYGILKVCEFLSIDSNLLLIMVQLETILFILIFEIQNKILSFYLNKIYSPLVIQLLSISLLFVIAIYAPFFNNYMYLGQWSPNTWHNPTTFIIKPIALLCFFGLFHFIQGSSFAKSKLFLIGLSSLFALSIWAKPSFVITFYPALLVFLMMFYIKNFKLIFKIALILIPSVVFLATQYYLTYYTELSNTSDLKDNIVFTYFGVTKLFTSNVFVSLLLAIAFPLTVLVFDFKNVKDNKILILAWLNALMGFLESSFLAEKFKFNQAAFAFGYNISLYILFIFSAIHFFKYIYKSTNPKVKWYGLVIQAVFLIHLLSGIIYFFTYILTKTFA